MPKLDQTSSPRSSLEQRHWFKLICGASYQHLPNIRNLALIYTLAGADCIDVASDPAVIRAAHAGIEAALAISLRPRPWLMISCNDGADPHFRKASFDSQACLTNCDRPCVPVCPTQAIGFGQGNDGVSSELCYGCGRCLSLCPVQIIQPQEQIYSPADLVHDPVLAWIDAIEIHTQTDRLPEFKALWQKLQALIPHLKLVSVSCGASPNLASYLHSLVEVMQPPPPLLIWQTDGRPMSGDLGKGASQATLKLASQVLGLQLPGYVQLAGGTNDYTIARARTLNLGIAGIGFGGYGRKLVAKVLDLASDRLEQQPHLLAQAVDLAANLVQAVKSPI
ncbi:MAG: LdpA C-terminal domain-containing domain [Pseudanabaenaceae cyanobacterium bins.68]|nr:LdpA C-terminal domain-containing domain [Pseudanabaenaceae cyanobacterium bins.68]